MTGRIQLGETDRISVLAVDSAAAGVTGATIDLVIRRTSDGYYWNDSSRVFQSSFIDITMTETDSTNLPGVYHYDFFPGVTDFKAVYVATTATVAVENDPWIGDIVVGYWVDDMDAALSSLSTDIDMTEVLGRIGSTVVETDMLKLSTLLHQLLNEIRATKGELISKLRD